MRLVYILQLGRLRFWSFHFYLVRLRVEARAKFFLIWVYVEVGRQNEVRKVERCEKVMTLNSQRPFGTFLRNESHIYIYICFSSLILKI